MKPAWEKLGDEFANSKTVLIGDVDCTVEKDLCSKYGVRGYPTIKYFTGATAADGDKYEGGRTFEDLKAFADENLGPSCGPDNKDLCDEAQLAEMTAVEKLSDDELAAKIAEFDGKATAAEEEFKTKLQGLQDTYQKISEEKDAKIAAVQPELRMLKMVK